MIIVPPEINKPERGHPLVIGRDPGEHEEEKGRPFVGKAGDELDYVLSNAGFRRQDCNITNVVGTRPPNNDFNLHDENVVASHLLKLYQLIDQLRPNLIITLGNEAAYSVVPGWPTGGRGIFKAKGIEDRRGYFWLEGTPRNTPVLTTLHPAGVLRKLVPGRYLLETDFRRARRWLNGDLPRETFPDYVPMTAADVCILQQHQLVSFDIETRNQNRNLLCCGFCGDDRIPRVVHFMKYRRYAEPLLTHSVLKVAHNGPYDLYGLWKMQHTIVRNYVHDTQLAWYALEPELAGRDESGGESSDNDGNRRMTRKGLAFLASIYFNVAWWKYYPDEGDPNYTELMMILNGRDVWVTREIVDTLLWEIVENDVWHQYREAMDVLVPCRAIQGRGLPINEALRKERYDMLMKRVEERESRAAAAGLQYVQEHEAPAFQVWHNCSCCGGGTKQRQHCWTCSGMPGERPSKKTEWPEERISELKEKLGKSPTVAQLWDTIGSCEQCIEADNGRGKQVSYKFDPFSTTDMRKLLYDTLHTPMTLWKNKVTVDENALKKILLWATEGKSGVKEVTDG